MSIGAIQGIGASNGLLSVQSRPKKAEEQSQNRNAGQDTVLFSSKALELAGIQSLQDDPVSTTQHVVRNSDASAIDPVSPVRRRTEGTRYEVLPSNRRQVSSVRSDALQGEQADIAAHFQEAFKQAGLSLSPPVAFSFENGNIQVAGERADIADVSNFVNSNPAVKHGLEILLGARDRLDIRV